MSSSGNAGPTGHKYTDTNISGYAQVHQGDQYNQTYIISGAQRTSSNLQFPEANKLGLLFRNAPEIDPDLFIGRQAELQDMEQILKPDDLDRNQRKLVLGGMGGVGKTQLAIAFAKRHQHSYTSVFWFNATSEALLRDSIRSVAPLFETSRNASSYDDAYFLTFFCKWLSESENKRWLLILDNYDDPNSYDIKKFFPYCSQGSIIVTTRQANEVAERFACALIHLQPLASLKEALIVLATRSGREIVDTDRAARRLTERFHGLPLALATAGAFLKRTQLSFEQYLKQYEARWVVSSRDPKPLAEYDSRTLYTTWDVSYEQLTATNPNAAHMLKLLAYFDNERIWYDLMKCAAVCSAGCCTPSQWIIKIIGDDTCFVETMGDLVNFSLLDFNVSTKTYSMHNCIHDWTLEKLNMTISTVDFWFAVGCIKHLCHGKDSSEFERPAWRQIAAHATRLSHKNLMSKVSLKMALTSQLAGLHDISYLLARQGRYEASVQIMQRVLSAYEERDGPGTLRILEVCHRLGITCANAGKDDQAEKLMKRAIGGRAELLGEQALGTLEVAVSLSSLYTNQRKVHEAEDMLHHALQRSLSNPDIGPDHLLSLEVMHKLGRLYWHSKRYDESEKLLEQVRNGCEQKSNSDLHRNLAMNVVNDLAWVYLMKRKLEEAEKLSIRSLRAREQYYGLEHSYTLVDVQILAAVRYDQGKLEEAETEYVRALEGGIKVFGEDHPYTIRARYNLAKVYRDQKRWIEAEGLLEDVVVMRRCVLGAETSILYKSLRILGKSYHLRGKLDAAEEKFREALVCATRDLGDHRRIKDVEWWLNHIQQMRENNNVCACIADAKQPGPPILQETATPGGNEDANTRAGINNRIAGLAFRQKTGVDPLSENVPQVSTRFTFNFTKSRARGLRSTFHRIMSAKK